MAAASLCTICVMTASTHITAGLMWIDCQPDVLLKKKKKKGDALNSNKEKSKLKITDLCHSIINLFRENLKVIQICCLTSGTETAACEVH